MKASVYDRLWRRECGEASEYASLRGIYGSKEWIDDLDIVNELGGHTGCVNALRYVCFISERPIFVCLLPDSTHPSLPPLTDINHTAGLGLDVF